MKKSSSSGLPLFLCPLLPATQKSLEGTIEVLPSSLSEAALIDYLTHNTPSILTVGANPVSATVLAAWRLACPDRSLSIIRRGTSLAAIDTKAAAKHGITVYNTPGVNASYVARHINDFLFSLPNTAEKAKVTIIGVGYIGALVANEALRLGHHVTLYSPTLANPHTQKEQLKARHLPLHPNLVCASTLEEACNDATHVAISAALTKEPMITDAHIKTMSPTVRVISVSEPSIFTPEAIATLYENPLCTVVMDNAKSHVDSVRKQLPSTTMRSGFFLQSQAMQAPSCQKDMDDAVVAKVAEVMLLQAQKQLTALITSSALSLHDPAITILGGGIMGLLVALQLVERHHSNITVIDDSTQEDWLHSGTSFVQRCRHASSTETTPHAVESRKETLDTSPTHGGWNLLTTRTAKENEWVERFKNLTRKPALQRINTEFVIRCNRRGLEEWALLRDTYPQLFENTVYRDPITRFYPTKDALTAGLMLQQSANNQCKVLSQEDLLKRHPAMAVAIEKGIVVGAIDVEGFGFDVMRFMENLQTYLKEHHVTFFADHVDETHKTSNGKRIFSLRSGKKHYSEQTYVTVGPSMDAPNFLTSDMVQHVVGCWLTLPNPGITLPTKIQLPDPVGWVNMLPSHDGASVYMSGGFGYIGKHPKPSIHAPEMKPLFDLLTQAAATLFPTAYKKACTDGSLDPRLCLRPMTPDGIAIVEKQEDIITINGTNAGGTVQGPWLARVAVDEREKGETVVTRLLSEKRFASPGPISTAPLSAKL